MERAGAHGGQRVPTMASSRLVERREGIDGLAVLGAVAGRDVVVLALDVQHHRRVGPIEQVGDHHADALAAAGGRRQHDRELARQRQELAAVAANDDAWLGRRATSTQQARTRDFGQVCKPRIAMQRAAISCGSEERHREHDQQRQTGCGDRADQLFAPPRIIRIGFPVNSDAVELRMARMNFVEQQEEHGREINRCTCEPCQADRSEHPRSRLAARWPTRHGQGCDAVHGDYATAANTDSSQRPSRCRRGS